MGNKLFTWDDATPEEPVVNMNGAIDANRWRIWEDLTLTDPAKDNATVTTINSQETTDLSNGLFGMGAVQLPNDSTTELANIEAVYNGVWVNNGGGMTCTIPDAVVNGQQIFICYDRIGIHPTWHVVVNAPSTGGWIDAQLAPAGFLHLYWHVGGPQGTGWYVFSFRGAVIG